MAIDINEMNTCFDLSLYDAIDRVYIRFLQYQDGRAISQMIMPAFLFCWVVFRQRLEAEEVGDDDEEKS